AQAQRQRRHHYPLRLEGTEQIARNICRRGLQRGNGRLERVVPQRASQPRRKSARFVHLQRHPEDTTNFGSSSVGTPSDVVAFATFMRFLDQPAASTTTPGGSTSIANGRNLFVNVVQ